MTDDPPHESADEAVQLPQPISSQAAGILRTRILTGRIPPGQRLNEVALSTEFGISRSPLREGIRKLADEGLVVLEPRRGAFVATFEPNEIADLMELRAGFDVVAARLAARRATDAQIAQLQQAIDTPAETRRNVPAIGPSWAGDFHVLLLQASDSPRLIERGIEIHTTLHFARFRSGALAERAVAARAEHQQILDHVKAHDPPAASEAMWEHLSQATEHMRGLGGGR